MPVSEAVASRGEAAAASNCSNELPATVAPAPAATRTLEPTGQPVSCSNAGKLAAGPRQEDSRKAVQQQSNAANSGSSKAANSSSTSKDAQPVPSKQQQQEHHALDDFRLAAALLSSTNSSSQPVQPSRWDTIPLMHIPRIVKALAVAPPPPPPPQVSRPAAAATAPGDGGGVGQGVVAVGQEAAAEVHSHPARPQTKARFRRVIQQTQQAMALLEKSMAAAAVKCNSAAGVEEQQAVGGQKTSDSTVQ